MMTLGKAPGAQFEISIDGKPRSYRDRFAVAIEAAEYLKRKFPNCDVMVKTAERGGDRGGVQARHGAALMPVTMRPTGLRSPVDKDRQDYTIFSGEWAMGRIYEDRGGPANLRWFWSLHGNEIKHDEFRTSLAGQASKR